MNTRIKLSMITTIVLGLFLTTPVLIHVLAQTTESNCVQTSVGKPPANSPGCGGGAGAAKVVELERAQIGKAPYVWGSPSRNWASEDPAAGKTPAHFDCSGLAGWAWYWGTGGKVNLPGSTSATWGHVSPDKYQVFQPSQRSELQPGDLIYWDIPPNIHHVGTFSGAGTCGGNDCFIEAYQTGKPVRENSLRKADTYMHMAGFIRPKY